MIKPTIGRVVWFQPARQADQPLREQPYPALICHVHSDKLINVGFFNENGTAGSACSVQLVQEGDTASQNGYYAEWMPYQVGQAKKHEAKDEDVELVGRAERDDRYLRAQIIEMALRTPGVSGHSDVLTAAAAYQAHIDGERSASAPQQLAERPALGAAFPGYSAMPPHQYRVVDEKCQLEARLAKLVPFFDTPIFAALDEGEKSRLERQEEAMKAYSGILTERIAAFTAAASITA
jgi:hypothetical protein